MIGGWLVPEIRELFKGEVYLLEMIVFGLLGGWLLGLSIRSKGNRRLRQFFILTGVSALGFLVSGVLHNLFYALGIITEGILGLSWLMEALGAIFFLTGVLLCPAGFLVGVVGGMIMLMKKGWELKKRE